MQISVRKDIRQRYLVINNGEKNEMNYRDGMIFNNQIPGFLSCFSEQMDSEELYYYEIPFGYWQLSGYLETEQTDGKLYRAVFRSLAAAMENAREYLLDADGILLDTEGILISSETTDILFVYYPNNTGSFEDNCTRLSESLLHSMNHNDPDAAELGYEFYKSCVRGKIGSEYLKEIAASKGQEDRTLPKRELYRYNENETEKPMVKEDNDEDYSFLFKQEEEKKKNNKKNNKKRKKRGLLGFFKNEKKEADRGDVSSMETVFLGKMPVKKVYGVLVINESGNRKEIDLEKDRYLIGKEIGGADIEVGDPGVSRLHARLMRAGDKYTVTDLGSVNGSFLNGIPLKAGEEITMENGDVLRLSDAELIMRY